MIATGLSTWVGTWKTGTGSLSTETQFFKKKSYSYASRFEGAVGGSPEELLAVAHAGCFNQALANNFGMIGLEADSIETSVAIDFGTGDDGHPAIKGSHITVSARAKGVSEEQFLHCADRARTNCTISKIMNFEITMDAKLLT